MKAMLSFSFFVYFMIGLSSIQAQTNLESAKLFNSTDSEGNTHSLKDYLDSGKHVMIFFSISPCSSCYDFLDNINQGFIDYGCNEDEVIFLMIDRFQNDSAANFLADSMDYYFPWITANGGANLISGAYELESYPTMILIAPDRTIIQQDIWPIDQYNINMILHEDLGFDMTSCILSVGNDYQKPIINVYPNPAQEFIQIESGSPVSHFAVYDVTGQLVKQSSPQMSRFSIQLDELPSGIYLCHIKTEQGIVVRKLVKQ